jgi:hypothetical protein
VWTVWIDRQNPNMWDEVQRLPLDVGLIQQNDIFSSVDGFWKNYPQVIHIIDLFSYISIFRRV